MTPTPIESSASDTRRGRGLRLQHRIVVPLILVALVSSGAAAWVAVTVTTSALRARLQSQLAGSATAVSRGDFALNPVILLTLRDIVGAQIVTLGPGGRIVASSVDDPDGPVVAAARRAADALARPGSTEPAAMTTDCGVPCMVVVRPVDGQPGLVVALVAETSALGAATRSVARAIMLAAVLSVAVIILVSQVVVRRVTAPLDRLVRFARQVQPDQAGRAEVGDDEIGVLAETFNAMLDRLARSRDALVQSEKLGLAGLFAAQVAHDIRNPLSSIKMQTQLLRGKAGADPEDTATLSSVLHDINLVESVVQDLLDLARPGELALEPGSINDVIESALRQLAPQFAHRKISVRADLAEHLPQLPLDAVRLKQVLLNVLVNASEAMPTGGEVRVRSVAGATGGVRVEIEDDGIGIDPGVLDRVFDPFVSTKRDGIGLGLVNAKAVVERHGGRIELAPRQPRGTLATIWLRAAAAPGDADPQTHG